MCVERMNEDEWAKKYTEPMWKAKLKKDDHEERLRIMNQSNNGRECPLKGWSA